MIKITLFNKAISVRAIYVLFLLIIVGAFIRYFGLGYSGLWLDEIFSMTGADPNTSLLDVYEYSKRDQPPLFFILLHGWLKLVGYTDFAGRSLTSLYGVLGIIAMYFIGKEIKGERFGLLAAFITTINWFHTDISKEIRFYPLVFLLATLSYLFYLRSIKRTKISDFFFYAVFTAGLLNTHYFALVVFTSQIIIFILVVIFYNRSPRLIGGAVVAGGISGLSLLHWLPIILADLKIQQFHVAPVKPTIMFDFAWSYIRDPLAFVVFSICIFFSVKGLYKAIRAKRLTIQQLVIGGWIFFGFMIPLLYSIIRLPLITHKYNTITVPALFLIIANGFLYFRNKNVLSYSLLAITLSGIIVLFFARPPYKPRRGEDWREVGNYFSKYSSQHNLVMFSQLDWFHFYYFKKQDLPLPVNQNSCDFSTLVSKTDSVWLLLNERYNGNWPINGFLPEQREIIAREFEISDVVKFKQTKAILYTRKE